ncbi:MAG: hypothetical protein COV72_07335 [Candidatus Omnitrophica bacterium CG11_big_fil_rev_8_21_14_0_20_42_13]|uniref:Uncharacterized protein n=1 Tax=Candidatus Ghiorseimicrobium undicola TaxID=1974746 RepID=A0A2H0LW83_9BACT|nr:MAG: hypothetical protein COV72_07335 [Candidatus Omnitrophica bacterium CG11_big_fil_rev_8_21_14_0_20_42_13]
MQRITYELDPHNNFVINKGGKKTSLAKFRRLIYGEFKIDKKNNLSYDVKSPVSESEDIPHQLKLNGEWSLSKNHDLRLSLNKEGRRTFGDKITLRGQIIEAGANSLLFALTSQTKRNTHSVYLLNFKGVWQADKNNRLSFHIKKENSGRDILYFNGAWQIDKNQQIIYKYEKAVLLRKTKKIHTLVFKGHWDIAKKLRLLYYLDKSTDSAFDFKASAALPREGYIKYELGIGVSDRKAPVRRVVTLYGRWRLKKDAGLLFEVEYAGKKPKAIIFGAEARLTDRDIFSFRLKNDIENKDLGMNIELRHGIFNREGEAFLRFLKLRRESAVYVGAGLRW